MFLRPPQSSETYHWIRCALVSVWNLVVSSKSTLLYLKIQGLIGACRLLSLATTVDCFLISSRVIRESWRRRHFLSISIRSWKLWKSQDSSALAVSSRFEAFIFMAASAQMLNWVARQLTSVRFLSTARVLVSTAADSSSIVFLFKERVVVEIAFRSQMLKSFLDWSVAVIMDASHLQLTRID